MQSPLISGRSRRSLPFRTNWLYATFLGSFSGWIIINAFLLLRGVDFETLLRGTWMPVIAGAPLGALLGVWMGTAAGTRRPWLFGAFVAAVTAVAATVWFTVYLVGRLGG